MGHREVPGIIPPPRPPKNNSEAKEPVAIEWHSSVYYQIGYRDGFSRGQEHGIKLAADILNTKPGQTILIQTPSEEKAKEFIEAAKKVFSREK